MRENGHGGRHWSLSPACGMACSCPCAFWFRACELAQPQCLSTPLVPDFYTLPWGVASGTEMSGPHFSSLARPSFAELHRGTVPSTRVSQVIYALYRRFSLSACTERGRLAAAATPPEQPAASPGVCSLPPRLHNPSPLMESWEKNVNFRYRSDCSTAELTSDAEQSSQRENSRAADTCTAPSCSVQFDEFGDAAKLRRKVLLEEGTQSLHATLSHCHNVSNEIGSPKQAAYSRSAMMLAYYALSGRATVTKPAADTSTGKGCMRRELSVCSLFCVLPLQRQRSLLKRPDRFPEFVRYIATPQEIDKYHKSAEAAAAYGGACSSSRDSVSSFEQGQPRQTSRDGISQRRNIVGSLNSCQSGACSQSGEAADGHYIANIEAVPVLQRAQKLRQIDIAITVYDSFKRRAIAMRPNVCLLLVHCALAAGDFVRAVGWLLEFLDECVPIQGDWLDRVIAATAVGASHLLQELLHQLERLRQSDKLSPECCEMPHQPQTLRRKSVQSSKAQLVLPPPPAPSAPVAPAAKTEAAECESLAAATNEAATTADAPASASLAAELRSGPPEEAGGAGEASSEAAAAAAACAETENLETTQNAEVETDSTAETKLAARVASAGDEAAAVAEAATAADSPSKRLNPYAPEFVPVYFSLLDKQQKAENPPSLRGSHGIQDVSRHSRGSSLQQGRAPPRQAAHAAASAGADAALAPRRQKAGSICCSRRASDAAAAELPPPAPPAAPPECVEAAQRHCDSVEAETSSAPATRKLARRSQQSANCASNHHEPLRQQWTDKSCFSGSGAIAASGVK
ncbi:uncharacterized protein LOC34621333 [Cyclospora cayetanensis]|uniref:Uncharacterized protein LOC34621333 n=1 Tax=Cyclospora cayetanensis TaxID=88456 RepID=A0A6P6RU60_9EIME|nr:uncharacterized protein LOC34621333 [Cyclospora cayetanensis]